MPTIQAVAEVPVDCVTAFDVAHDPQKRRAWDPFIRRSRLLDTPDGKDIAVGERVWARAHNGLSMTVRYEAIQRPHLAAMRMTRGPWFFRKFTGVWRFSPAQPGTTTVLFRYSFEARPAGLRRLFHPPLRHFLQRDIERRLAQFATHLRALAAASETQAAAP